MKNRYEALSFKVAVRFGNTATTTLLQRSSFEKDKWF